MTSEKKIKIYEEMQKANLCWGEFEGDFDSFFGINKKVIEPLCRLLNIERVEIGLKAPKTKLVPSGFNHTMILFESDEKWSDTPLTVTKETVEGGSFFLKFYHKIDSPFTEFELDQIHVLSEMMYGYGGRARTRSLLRKALKSDIMTGLPNLETVMEFAGKNIQLGRIGLYNAYFLNVKNFKYVNRMSDQHRGDETMTMYARKLAALAEGDEIVGRLGGDNFIALIKKSETVAFLEGIKRIPVDVYTNSGIKSIYLSAVAGVFEIPEDIKNPREILLPISFANQLAKQVIHRDVVFYNDDIAQKIIISQRVMMSYNEALANGEFKAYLQPKIDLHTDKVCGAEALARWERGGEIIPPGEFIPPLERDGSICRLDFEILKQTCDIIQHWVDEGKNPVKISVNLSRWHLEDPETAEKIIEMVNGYSFDPSYLEFEITETVDFKEYEALTKLLFKLQKHGFTTSVDDFGTGYSSITMLKDFDLDIIKLDRAFVASIGEKDDNTRDKILVSAVINLAKSLNMQVLAEGVETETQLDYLRSAGCDMVQGFFFSKPVTIKEFEDKYIK